MKEVSSTFSILGYPLYSLPLNTISVSEEGKQIINTLNPHSYCIAKMDTVFYNALQNSDILLPDGSGIVLASKIIHGRQIAKIAGSDVHMHLLNELNQKGGRVFYLGTTSETLLKIRDNLTIQFPNLIFSSYSPPFKPEFSDTENKIMTDAINIFAPDILFVGMTAPKQEKWVYINQQKISAKIICSIGAVFDFYAGTKKRSGKIWIKLGLEWLPRLIREPKRMWQRNFISTPLFLLDVIRAKWKK